MSTQMTQVRPGSISATIKGRLALSAVRPVTVQEVAQLVMAAPTQNFLTATAAVDLLAHHVVCYLAGQLHYAEPDDPDCEPIGITPSAAMQGAQATVQTSDVLFESGWSWTPGPIYLGAGGTLVQTPPAHGAQVQVALAMTPTRILVRIHPPIQLS
jgi:hypothetical protein